MPNTGFPDGVSPDACFPGTCFHCGEPLSGGRAWPVVVQQTEQQTCCPGCQAVCRTIVDLGLENYYQHRDRHAVRLAAGPIPDNLFAKFGDAALAETGYITATTDDERSCTLIVDDMRCAACGWLIEKSLKNMPGVTLAGVNVSSGRLRVQWQPGHIELRDILLRIRKLGYRVLPFRGNQAGTGIDTERRNSLLRLVVAGFGMMQVMHVAIGFYGDAAHSMSITDRDYLRVISFIVTTPVVFYAGWPFLRNAWLSVRGGVPGMDVPVALAILLAYLASLWSIMIGGPEVWFDSIVMFVFFLSVGRHLELEARRKATRTVDNLSAALPLTATRLVAADENAAGENLSGGNAQPSDEEIIPATQLKVGDMIRVKPGETIPADGFIRAGGGHINEAMLTGESVPVRRRAGDLAIGGCTSMDAVLQIEVSASPANGRLARIVDLVTRVQADKPKLQELADRIATHFVLALLLLTALAWLGWHFVDPDRAFWIALAVLVVGCPCALSLATPVVYTVATNYLTARGLLLAQGRALSMLPNIKTVVFDKTGTLTEGRPVLSATKTFGSMDADTARSIAAALEADSEHPIARAFRHGFSQRATDVCITPGGGIEGDVDGTRYRIGSRAFVSTCVGGVHALVRSADRSRSWTAPTALQSWMPPTTGADDHHVWLATRDTCIAAFTIADAIRPEAAATVAALTARGIDVHLLSGDASAETQRLADVLGIKQVRAGVTPEGKVEYLRALRARSGAPVLMVGDGINDAPVLAAADVSMAMGEGTDLARMSADAVLLRPDLTLIPQALATACATERTVRQNLGWALGYNFAMIPLAMIGWVPPWVASLGMSASSLFVVLNALALERRVPNILEKLP